MIELAPGIVVDESICKGQPIIQGTRIQVSIIVGHLAAGDTMERVMAEYHLTRAEVLAALSYAAKLVSDEEVRIVK